MSERMRTRPGPGLCRCPVRAQAFPGGDPGPGPGSAHGSRLANPVVADYVGGLAAFDRGIKTTIGETRIPVRPAGSLSHERHLAPHSGRQCARPMAEEVSDGGVDYRREVVLEFLAPRAPPWPASVSARRGSRPTRSRDHSRRGCPARRRRPWSVEVVTLVFERLQPRAIAGPFRRSPSSTRLPAGSARPTTQNPGGSNGHARRPLVAHPRLDRARLRGELPGLDGLASPPLRREGLPGRGRDPGGHRPAEGRARPLQLPPRPIHEGHGRARRSSTR